MLPYLIAIASVIAIIAAIVAWRSRKSPPAPAPAPAPTPAPATRPRIRSLTLARGTQIVLLGSEAELTGWIEIETHGAEQRLAVLNLSANPADDRAAERKRERAFPTALHISTASTALAGALDFANGTGSIAFPIAVAYDELEATAPPPDTARGAPLTVPGRMTLALARLDDRLELRGSGTIDRLPPFARSEVPFDFTSIPVAVTGRKCGEVTLCVDVARSGNPAAPLVTQAQLDAAIAELNRIWGCPGQCCIRFTAGPPTHRGNDTIVLRDGNENDVARLRAEFRNVRRPAGGCFPVLITGSIMTGVGGGGSFDDLGTTIRHGENATRGSVVTAQSGGNPLTPVAIGNILAHELGHAMGVSNAPINPNADGDVGHSSNQDNLMRESGDPTLPDATLQANTKLNAKQCVRARNSSIVRQTQGDCDNAPLEVV